MSEKAISRIDLGMSNAAVRAPGQMSGSPNLQRLHFGGLHQEGPPNFRVIIEKLLTRKNLILAVALIVLIPAAIATFVATPLYRSTAVLQFNLDDAQVLPYRDINVSGSSAGSYESALMTQEQILKSPVLLNRVVQRLTSEPESNANDVERYLLNQRFEIRRIAASQLFQISWLGPSPDLAAKVVNLYTEEYIKQHLESRQAARQKARQGLARELENLEKKVQLSEKELVRYAKDNNIMAVEPGRDLVEKKLATLDQQVAEIEAELAVARSRLESVQKASVKEFPERYSTPLVQALTSKLFQMEHDLTSLRSSYGENWPAVVQKRNETALARDQLEREKSVVLAQAREQARLDLEAVEGRYRRMATSLSEQKGLVGRFQNASIQYNILQREVETNKKLYEGLLDRLKQTGVMAGLEFGNIQVIEPAIPNPVVDSPKILWNLGLASLLGLALGICVAFIADYWDNSISTLEDVEELAALPVLGSVPLFLQAGSDRIPLAAGWRRVLLLGTGSRLPEPDSANEIEGRPWPTETTEAIRNICASILLSRSEQEPHVIVVTSAEPAEGKTTIASQLGRALADYGKSTLIVEGDLRRPGLSKLFGVGCEDGLSLFLSGHVNPLPKIHSTENANLWLVAAGPKPPNPLALLSSEKMSSFLNEMARLFKFVIIDSPPLLAVSDARALAVMSDGVVLVIRAGRTPKSQVLQASALLDNFGANTIGIVLNGGNLNSRSAYYNAYYQETTEA